MTVATYEQWLVDGSPWFPAPCIATFAATLRGHGYTVNIIGDLAHLRANPPQDHTPYSHTPWPGPQPYPLVLALDIMPGGGPLDWRRLGRLIVEDRTNAAMLAETEWIKYINWTDPDTGECWHTSWEPGQAQTPSSDTGHIHISARTDLCHAPTTYDPLAHLATPPPGDPIMTQLPILRRGATGLPVENAQALLNTHGYQLAEDGDYGPLTESATRAYQSAHPPLDVDGVIGPHTWAMLLLGHDL
jgi:hypothetical protein